jgi:hypothetical protein
MEAMFMSHIEFVVEYPGVPRMVFGELQSAESTPAKRMARQFETAIIVVTHDEKIIPTFSLLI